MWQVACEFLAASRKLDKQGFTPAHAWNRLGEFRDLLPAVPGRARAKYSGRCGTGADESLRAFVRALARQTARECFHLELKRRSRTIQ